VDADQNRCHWNVTTSILLVQTAHHRGADPNLLRTFDSAHDLLSDQPPGTAAELLANVGIVVGGGCSFLVAVVSRVEGGR